MPDHELDSKGYYRSDLREIIVYPDGERQVEEVYEYYIFTKDGKWASKSAEYGDFDFRSHLLSIGLDLASIDPDQDEPVDSDGSLPYQIGTFEVADGRVHFEWFHSQLEEGSRSWSLHIEESGDLVMPGGDYRLRLFN